MGGSAQGDVYADVVGVMRWGGELRTTVGESPLYSSVTLRQKQLPLSIFMQGRAMWRCSGRRKCCSVTFGV